MRFLIFGVASLALFTGACGLLDDGESPSSVPRGDYCLMATGPVVFGESGTTLSVSGLDLEFEQVADAQEFTLSSTVSGLGDLVAQVALNDALSEGTVTLTVTLEGGGGQVQLKQWLTQGSCPSRDVDTEGLEQVLTHLFVDMAQIEDISLFRSSAGHDYSDDFENCRSMKHYFEPISKQNSLNTIYAPIAARVVSLGTEEGGGFVDDGLTNQRVVLQPVDHPAYEITLFHVDLSSALQLGDTVTAGQQLGHARLVRVNSGSSSASVGNDFDIAVAVNTPSGRKLVSYFEMMPDSVFALVQAHAVSAWSESSPARSDFILSQSSRDAQPLSCSGETFTNSGTDPLSRWFR